MKIHEIIMELGDSPLQYKVAYDDKRQFIASAGEIEVDFYAFTSGRMEITFSVGGSMRITGKGEAFKVFSTAAKIVSDNLVKFLAKNPNVTLVFFTAEEPSRVKLYDKFAPYISKILGNEWMYRRVAYPSTEGIRYEWKKHENS